MQQAHKTATILHARASNVLTMFSRWCRLLSLILYLVAVYSLSAANYLMTPAAESKVPPGNKFANSAGNVSLPARGQRLHD
jgi:hypothetical protein